MSATRINQVHSVEQLQEIYAEAQPNHIALYMISGQGAIPFNKYGRVKADAKMVEIASYLQKKTTLPGQYLFVTKQRHTKDCPIFEYPVNVGNVDSQILAQAPVMSQPVKQTYSDREHIENMLSASRFEMLYEFEKKTNELLQKKVDDLERELRGFRENGGTGNTWVKDLEVFKPLAEVFFDQRKEELQLKSREIGLKEGKLKSGRSDNGCPVGETQEYLTYFHNIVNSGNEAALNYECDLLELQNPELYKKLSAHYKISE